MKGLAYLAALAAWFVAAVVFWESAIRALPPTPAEKRACMIELADADECARILARVVWCDSREEINGQ